MKKASFALAAVVVSVASFAGADALSDWPAGTAPEEISRRITDQFLTARPENYKPQGYYGNEGYGWNWMVQYSVVSIWINALECARLTNDKERTARLLKLFDDFRPGGRLFHVCSKPYHVDDSIFGALPYEIYLTTGDRRCLEMGNWYADMQWSEPCWGTYVERHNAPRERQWEYYRRGFSPQTRLWIDDMYMITVLQSQAFRATGDRKYIDRAAKEMCFYLDELQLKEGRAKGLFYHAPDVPFVWARGAGWMAAGMALVLDRLPTDSAYREQIMSGYRLMMEALLRYQRPDGFWCQLVDRPDEAENWAETSGTAMYAYAFVVGIRRGWLDASVYGPAFRKAYLALCAKLDRYGNLAGVCEGTGKNNDKQHYYARRRVNGDPHGQAPMLWICGSLMESAKAASPVCERTAEGVRLVRGGRTLWSFSASDGKPCVHPLCLPDGTRVTGSREADHPWHRGLWFSWKFLNGVNYWETDAAGLSAGEQRVTATDIACDGATATVRMDVAWGARTEPFRPVLTERREVSFSSPAADGSYEIGWQAEFTACERTVIGRTPPSRRKSGEWGGGYAGFSLRLDAGFAAAAQTRTSCGATGQVDVVARERRWIEYSVPQHGGIRLEVVEAPEKTTFYHWPDRRFTSLSPVFDGDLTLERGQRLRLAYRVTVHPSSPSASCDISR